MRIQLLRNASSAIGISDVTSNVPLADPVEDSGEGQATVRLLDLRGLEYRSLKVQDAAAYSKKVGLSKRLSRRRLGVGKNTASHANTESKNDGALAAPSSPAKVVVWCHKSQPNYLNSCQLNEETMDDEGNVHSWSCVWPGGASSLNIPLPPPHEGGGKGVIHLGMGVRLQGEDKIHPLGIANVDVPEDKQATLDVSVPIVPIKQKTGLLGKFGAKQSNTRSCEYAISPSTVLSMKLQVTSQMPSSKNIFDSLVMVNSHMAEKIDRGSETGSVGTEATSTASDGSASQRMGTNSKNAAVSVGGSHTVKAANVTSPCDASDVFSIESVESVLNGASKQKSVMMMSDDGELSNTKLADVFILPATDSPVAGSSTNTTSKVSEPKDEPSSIQAATPVNKKDTKKSKRMFETLDRKSLMALIALKDTFDDLTVAVGEMKDTLVEQHSGPNDTMRALDDLNETFEKLKVTYSEPDHLAHESFSKLKGTFDKLEDTFGALKQNKNPKQDMHKQVDTKMYTAFVQLNRSYDKLKHTFKRKKRAENNVPGHEEYETLGHKPMMAFVELKQTMSDISNEEITVESFGKQVEVFRSPEEEKQADSYKSFQSVGQNEWTGFCGPSVTELLENVREGLADIIACGCFTEDQFGDDVTCRTDCTSLETYETTKYSQQESTLCTSDNTIDTTIGSISNETISNPQESNDQNEVPKETEVKKTVETESVLQEKSSNENEMKKEADMEREIQNNEVSKEKGAKEGGNRRKVGSFISRLPSLHDSENKKEASVENEGKEDVSNEGAHKDNGGSGRASGFISRLPPLPSRKSTGSDYKELAALSRPPAIVRSNSTRSASRLPTPSERLFLESKYKCDGSVSVYSV